MKTAFDQSVERLIGITTEELLAMTQCERFKYIEKRTGKPITFSLNKYIESRGCVLEDSMYLSEDEVNAAFDMAIEGSR